MIWAPIRLDENVCSHMYKPIGNSHIELPVGVTFSLDKMKGNRCFIKFTLKQKESW
jgi:hypothetical protein